MNLADYLIILLFFTGLLAVGYLLGKKIASSKDMFMAGKSSSWWISGLSTYMTIFSASTFAVWGGVAYKSGLVAAFLGMMLGIASIAVGLWVSGKWSRMNISSPAEFLTVRFGDKTLKFYSVVLILGRAVHTAVSLYAIAIMVVALMPLPEGNFFADPATGHLSVVWAVIALGLITLAYTTMGGYLAVLMTDVVQFAVLFAMILILVPLSLREAGGVQAFIAAVPEGYFRLTSSDYTGSWMVLWLILNFFMIAAMMSATLSMVSGTLNVFANVFTCDLYLPRHPQATEAQKVRVGRIFTFVYGVVLVVIGAIIPLLGGAEKVVVTILTVAICPIFIPSIWGLFSKKIKQSDVFIAMGVAYVFAFLSKFHLIFPAYTTAHPVMTDAICGCVIPIVLLTFFELVGLRRPVQPGYAAVEARIRPESEAVPEAAKKAGKAYSGMALTIMMGTYLAIGVISLLLSLFYPANRHLLLLVGGVLTVFSALVLALYRKWK